MRLEKLSRWDLLAAISAAALLASLFLTWFDPSADDEVVFSVTAVDAWDGLEAIAPALAAIAAASLLLVLVKGSRIERRAPVSPWIAVLGLVALVLVGLRLIEPPDLGAEIGGLGRGPGAWLALAASAGLLAGGYLGMGKEGTSFRAEADRLSKPLPERERPKRPPRRRAPEAPPRPRPKAAAVPTAKGRAGRKVPAEPKSKAPAGREAPGAGEEASSGR